MQKLNDHTHMYCHYKNDCCGVCGHHIEWHLVSRVYKKDLKEYLKLAYPNIKN